MQRAIPKRIFYVWLGSSRPADVSMAVYQWQQFLPDYEIVELNEKASKYFDFEQELKQNDWFRTVYEKKMWAYAADYIRCKVLYEHGGIYLDTDISIVKSFDDLLGDSFFCGKQGEDKVNLAVFGCPQHNVFIKKILDFYNEEIWQQPYYSIPDIATFIMQRDYQVSFSSKQEIIKTKDSVVYPPEYFYPLKMHEAFDQNCLTPNSYTIHWWKESWCKNEITTWLKNKHLRSKTESMKAQLFSRHRIYLFNFLRVFDYSSQDGIVRLSGIRLPFLKIKKVSGRIKVTLFGFIPFLKIR